MSPVHNGWARALRFESDWVGWELQKKSSFLFSSRPKETKTGEEADRYMHDGFWRLFIANHHQSSNVVSKLRYASQAIRLHPQLLPIYYAEIVIGLPRQIPKQFVGFTAPRQPQPPFAHVSPVCTLVADYYFCAYYPVDAEWKDCSLDDEYLPSP